MMSNSPQVNFIAVFETTSGPFLLLNIKHAAVSRPGALSESSPNSSESEPFCLNNTAVNTAKIF